MPVIDKKVYTFQYLMKLHYSQTLYRLIMNYNRVSVPYEITLLSNLKSNLNNVDFVSVPYEITLLSNLKSNLNNVDFVSVPYEITLLSN